MGSQRKAKNNSRDNSRDGTAESPVQNKRTGIPLNGEKVINMALKYIIGFLLFWAIYYPMYGMEMDALTELSFFMLYSLAAQIFAILVVWIMMIILLRLLRRPKKSIFDLNPIKDSFLQDMLEVVINGFFMVTQLLTYLDGLTSSWEQFILLYAFFKALAVVLAYILAILIRKSLMASVAFYILFFCTIMISLTEITGMELYPK
jgi:hypothetical protein